MRDEKDFGGTGGSYMFSPVGGCGSNLSAPTLARKNAHSLDLISGNHTAKSQGGQIHAGFVRGPA